MVAQNENNKFDFPKSEGLQTRSAVYVPSTNGNRKISDREFQSRISETRRFLNKNFGGSTSVKAKGSFTGRNNKLVNEDVVVVEHWTSKPTWNRKDRKMEKWLLEKQKEWNQESIGFEYQDKNRPERFLFVKSKRKQLKSLS